MAAKDIQPFRVLENVATFSRLARQRFGTRPTLASPAFEALQSVKDSEAEHTMLITAHDFALVNLIAAERTCVVAARGAVHHQAGFPVVFLLRPLSELTARIWLICRPGIGPKERSDEAAAQYRDSVDQNEGVARFVGVLGGDEDALRAAGEDLVRNLNNYQQIVGKSAATSVRETAKTLFANEGVLQTVAELFGHDDVYVDASSLPAISLGRARVNHQSVHNDPILTTNWVHITESRGLSEHTVAALAWQFLEYLLVASYSTNQYFGWADDLYLDAFRKAANLLAGYLDNPRPRDAGRIDGGGPVSMNSTVFDAGQVSPLLMTHLSGQPWFVYILDYTAARDGRLVEA